MHRQNRRRSWPCPLLFGIMTFATAIVIGPGGHEAASDENDWRRAVVQIERPREGGLPAEVGTGFFVSSAGHILTAAHVLLESDESDEAVRGRPLNVRLFGDSVSRSARVLAMNRFTDLALLKIKTDGETPLLPLGDSGSVRSGDLLTIIGHPLGRQDWNVSAAIVDSITPQERIFLQATLFKGQSGGPALDKDGRVVGIASYREEAAQQSYLAPINDALGLLAGYVTPVTQGAAVLGTAAVGSAVQVQTNQTVVGEESEPNNNVRQANTASIGKTVLGSIGPDSDGRPDYDYILFKNTGADPVRAIVRNIDSQEVVFLHVQILDNKENELVSGLVSYGSTLSESLPRRSGYYLN